MSVEVGPVDDIAAAHISDYGDGDVLYVRN